MIKVAVTVPVKHTKEDLVRAAAKELRVKDGDILELAIVKQSIDARKKDRIVFLYALAVRMKDENRFLRKGFEAYKPKRYRYEITGTSVMKHRPVVIGAGPAGLFNAYLLSIEGFRPIVLERGPAMEERVSRVEAFYEGAPLDGRGNVQFGEGGAGTFSDGKLNTLVKDKDGKGRFVLETFVKFGAPEEILYRNKPHIGTDKLRTVIVNMRNEIIRLGGEFRFETKAERFLTEGGRLTGIVTDAGETIPCETAVLAIGHSSRDTIRELFKDGITMEPKAYAMGVRIQHRREFIDRTQYGDAAADLPAADYKLTYTAADGRGVYSFCMCPGGYVVNASSEPGRLAVNGMSNFARDAENSNSAIVVTVTPEDYLREVRDESPLAGMIYQERLEEKAYNAGLGKIPTQRFGDYEKGVPGTGFGSIKPVTKGAVHYTNLREVIPEYIGSDLIEGIHAFDKTMPGFADEDALLCAIESRTSSPVRITRDDSCESVSLKGLYPCGEGAGYAGGIMSAAMDGIRVFEAITKEYKAVKE
ncbi:MAG: FAD-dependent oxidoreductase [Lachnospiraceae bacterium]|nr:FAD-dependent oxidoreductase [Lachnospiraceae bacterium]